MSDETQPAMAYPSKQQYADWKRRAETLDMSVSEFMQAMIHAGTKKFDATVAPDETNRELREQRNDIKDELAHARERIHHLETQLHAGERETIQRYVAENPGATWAELTQHLIDTAPERTTHQLDVLEGDALRVEDGAYYLRDEGEDAIE